MQLFDSAARSTDAELTCASVYPSPFTIVGKNPETDPLESEKISTGYRNGEE